MYNPTEPQEPVEHEPVQLLEIEPEKLTQEEEERIRNLEGLIVEEEGRSAEVQEDVADEEQGEGEG